MRRIVATTPALDGQEMPSPLSAFSRSVLDLLERIEYRRCESGEDLEAVYRLRYKAFHGHGLLDTIIGGKLVDHLDETPNCYSFGVFMEGQLVSTVRLHHLTADMPAGPIMTVFGDRLMPRLAAGETFIDPSRLSIDPDLTSSANRALPYVTLRLAVMANEYFRTTSCVSMIRAEHAPFYQRIFGSSAVGAPRLYPPFTMPIFLYEARCDEHLQPTLDRFPFFNSTAGERRMMFAKPAKGELAPLTILPTAKYMLQAA
jgi:N-acyl-L-homoserine lactone synthetase